MYLKKSFLAIIPARGGSKRLPKKNLLPMMDKPLIEWSLRAALGSKYIDDTVVSSDNKKILSIADSLGAKTILRPNIISDDCAKTVDVISHALHELKNNYDYIVLLQPTSPLRNSNHIDQAVELLFEKNADSIISVTKANHSPHLFNKLPKNDSMKNFLLKQDENKVNKNSNYYYRLNGAIYIIQTDKFLLSNSLLTDKTFAFHMSQEHSIDIDTAFDFFCAEAAMSLKFNKLEYE